MKQQPTRPRRKQGFTLMEMLIVVAIIAVLTAVAIPTFNSALNSARLATDDANERSLKALAAMAVSFREVETESGPEPLAEGEDLMETFYYTTDGTLVSSSAGIPANVCRSQGDSSDTPGGHAAGKALLVLFLQATDTSNLTYHIIWQ